jgi:hypothetical protein
MLPLAAEIQPAPDCPCRSDKKRAAQYSAERHCARPPERLHDMKQYHEGKTPGHCKKKIGRKLSGRHEMQVA